MNNLQVPHTGIFFTTSPRRISEIRVTRPPPAEPCPDGYVYGYCCLINGETTVWVSRAQGFQRMHSHSKFSFRCKKIKKGQMCNGTMSVVGTLVLEQWAVFRNGSPHKCCAHDPNYEKFFIGDADNPQHPGDAADPKEFDTHSDHMNKSESLINFDEDTIPTEEQPPIEVDTTTTLVNLDNDGWGGEDTSPLTEEQAPIEVDTTTTLVNLDDDDWSGAIADGIVPQDTVHRHFSTSFIAGFGNMTDQPPNKKSRIPLTKRKAADEKRHVVGFGSSSARFTTNTMNTLRIEEQYGPTTE